MNRLITFLLQLISGLKLTRLKPVSPASGLVIISIVLSALLIYLQPSPLVQDWEQRFQSNFHLFSTFFGTPKSGVSPIVVVLINDDSLPEGTPRSPINRHWLGSLINRLSDHRPALIGLNILLDRPLNPADDQTLSRAIADSGHVVIRNDSNYPALARFRDAALDYGNLRFRFDSSGSVQEICHSSLTCRGNRFFHARLLKQINTIPAFKHDIAAAEPQNWLRINFSGNRQLSEGGQSVRFPIFYANELDQVPAGALQGKIVLIGTGFPDLYPLYRTPLAADEQFLQETEILARVVDMFLGNRLIKPLPFIWPGVIMLAVFLGLSFLLSRKGILRGVWFTAIALPILFLAAAVALTFYRVEVPFVLPAVMLSLFLGIGIIQQTLQERFSRLMAELSLKDAKIDFLTNELHTHHLFNELSRLNVMIGQHPESARAYLVEFAELLRASLKYGDQSRVPVKVQMDYLETYLQQQGIIQGDKFQFFIDIKGDFEEAHAPWHVFFPLVENAVKQSEAVWRAQPNQPAKIEIVLWKEGNRVHFRVTNPYLPDAGIQSTGKGLENLENRLKWSYPRGGYKLSGSSHAQIWTADLELPLS